MALAGPNGCFYGREPPAPGLGAAGEGRKATKRISEATRRREDSRRAAFPRLANDRLLLGMKGTMSEMELSILRQRAHEALKQKARRGELFTTVVIGYVRSGPDQIDRDPDLRVQEANMKFMMNGALTLGTRDGATIEMAEAAGKENFFLFGLTSDQVAESRAWYNPHWHYQNEPETRAALDLIFSDHFSPEEPGIFEPLRDALLTHGDYYMHLADLRAYLQADERVVELYRAPDEWTRKSILNVASSGKFSSDRAIAEYASQIWRVAPCPVG